MTLSEAFIHFSKSEAFKEIAKERGNLGGKFRGYLSRFNSGRLGNGAIVEILIANGYEVTANKAELKK